MGRHAVFLCSTSVACLVAAPALAVNVTVDPTVQHQTMRGWEAVAQIGGLVSEHWPAYQDQLLDDAVELGINRLRLEVGSGLENPTDAFAPFRDGEATEIQWLQGRYNIINDNNDPNVADLNGFNFSELDYKIETIVQPMQQRLQARGERLWVNLNYVDFNKDNDDDPNLDEHKDSPAEYAEFMSVMFNHMQNEYGFVPDSLEIALEPVNAGWNAEQIGNAIVAVKQRLNGEGFDPQIIAVSQPRVRESVNFFDNIETKVPDAIDLIDVFAYHRYADGHATVTDQVNNPYLSEVWARASANGMETAMLEHIGGDIHELHYDLTVAQASA